MDMTRDELQAVTEPRPWGSFKEAEQAWMRFLAGQGLSVVRGWLQAAMETRETDATVFGMDVSVMEHLALRVARHLTGAQPVPELAKRGGGVNVKVNGWDLKKLEESRNQLGHVLRAGEELKTSLAGFIMELDRQLALVRGVHSNLDRKET